MNTFKVAEGEMDTDRQSCTTRGVLVWLRGSPPMASPAGETGILWFCRCLARGVVVLVPVVLAISACFAAGNVLGLALMIVVLFSFFGYLIALLPAITGAMLYLPLVWWAARRWPRAGRAVAVACGPVMMLGTLPYWEMWRMAEMWQMWIPAAAGILVWTATLPLPAPALRAGGGVTRRRNRTQSTNGWESWTR